MSTGAARQGCAAALAESIVHYTCKCPLSVSCAGAYTHKRIHNTDCERCKMMESKNVHMRDHCRNLPSLEIDSVSQWLQILSINLIAWKHSSPKIPKMIPSILQKHVFSQQTNIQELYGRYSNHVYWATMLGWVGLTKSSITNSPMETCSIRQSHMAYSKYR